jgi:hypothetical protein
VTAVAYDSRCETSTFETEAALLQAAIMDAQVATAPRVLLVLPTDTGDDDDDDSGTSTGTESGTAAASEVSSGSEAGSDGGSEDGRSGGAAGLSTGAKVAIGVVVPLFVILVVALIWFFIHHRKKRAITNVDALAPASSPPVASTEDGFVTKAELPASSMSLPNVAFQKPELDGEHPHHAPSTEVGEVYEMPAKQTPTSQQ